MNRIFELDVLRFAAIALVLGRHIYICPESVNAALHHFTRLWCKVGWIGVDLFFALSGFLVSSLLFKEQAETGAISPWRFYVRRGFKIYPSYAVLLLATLGVMCWQFQVHLASQVPWEAFREAAFQWLWPNATFTQNYFQDLETGLAWSVRLTWSLAVEEHFYLLLPWLLVALRGKDGEFRFLPHAVAAVCAVCFWLRLQLPVAFTTQTHLMPTHLRIDSLLLGVLVGWMWREVVFAGRAGFSGIVDFSRGLVLFSVVGWIAALLVSGDFSQERFFWTFGYLGLAVTFAALVWWAALRQPFSSNLLTRTMAKAGRRSYATYLMHPISAWVAGRWCNPTLNLASWLGWAAIYLCGAIAAGWILTWAVERPFLRLRDKWFPAL